MDDMRFKNEDAARAYLEALLWPQGPVCPHCGAINHAYLTKRRARRGGVYRCAEPPCRKDFTVTMDTVLERSHIPLHKWLRGFELFAAGASAYKLHCELDITERAGMYLHARIKRVGGSLEDHPGRLKVRPRVMWTNKEQDILRQKYASAPWEEISAALPKHPRPSIEKMASSTLKLKRARQSNKFSPIAIIRALRRRREEIGMNAIDLAEHIGVHRVMLLKWERGEGFPRFQNFLNWMEALECHVVLQKGAAQTPQSGPHRVPPVAPKAEDASASARLLSISS